MQTRLLYAGENRMTAMRLATLDLPEGNAMRAPGEAPGLMALEIAIDEIAEKVGIDPVQFRILNDTQVDPEKPERPFSHRDLVGCLKLGAERFGWDVRGKPGSKREGQWLIGTGVAAAFRNNLVMPSGARVKLDSEGVITVETDMTDIGTGSYTIIAQTAAEMMGVAMDKVGVHLGDSRFPRFGRFRRAVRCQFRNIRRLCRLRKAAGGNSAKTWLQFRRCGLRKWHRSLRQPVRPAGGGGRFRWSGGRRHDDMG